MFLHGPEGFLDNYYMQELRKLAIIQTKMNCMIAKGTYGKSFYALWKDGKSPSIHFSKNNTHMSLHTDRLINPLGLPETIWWALMMFMLGLFNEQYNVYGRDLHELEIEENNFSEYMRKTYSPRISGNPVFETFSEEQKSTITFESFSKDVEVFSIKNHLSLDGSSCISPYWYSLEEFGRIRGTCVCCKKQLLESDLCPVISGDYKSKLMAVLSVATPLTVM
jgi:hypothetical protein